MTLMMSLVFRDLYEFRHLSSASGCVNAWETSQFLNLVCVNGQCSTCVPSRLRQFGNVRLIFGRWRCWTFWSRPDNASEIEITRPSHRLSPCLMGFCYRITRLQIQTAKQQNSTVFGETVLAILFSYVSVCTKDLCLCSQARSLGYPNTMLSIWFISIHFFRCFKMLQAHLRAIRLMVVQQLHPVTSDHFSASRYGLLKHFSPLPIVSGDANCLQSWMCLCLRDRNIFKNCRERNCLWSKVCIKCVLNWRREQF